MKQESGADVYKTAKVGQMLSSALNDKRRKDSEDKLRGRMAQDELDDDGDFTGFEGVFASIRLLELSRSS